MKMEPLKSGRLKIWLTARDMEQWGLRFETMSTADRATRHALLRLIAVARERASLNTEDGVTAEVIPLDGGCLMLLTPLSPLPPCAAEPVICTFQNENDLLGFGRGLRPLEESALPTSSLFGWGTAYRLIVYPSPTVSRSVKALLGEYAIPTARGYPAAAYTEEHGVPLSVGDALQRLRN